MKYTFTKCITKLGQVVENLKKKNFQIILYYLKGLETSPKSFSIFLKPL